MGKQGCRNRLGKGMWINRFDVMEKEYRALNILILLDLSAAFDTAFPPDMIWAFRALAWTGLHPAWKTEELSI